VYFDEAELKRLTQWARERKWTKSQAIRAAVRALTHGSGEDPLLELSGDIEGLAADVSKNFRRYLDETFSSRRPIA